MTTTTYLITGGAGFIGSNLVHAIVAKPGARVVVIDKLTYAGNRDNLSRQYGLVEGEGSSLQFVDGDICDGALVRELFVRHEPDVVMNLAAESHVDRSIDDPGAFIKTNVQGTFELLDAARGAFSRMQSEKRARFRFVHVSTDEVFGSLTDVGYFDEETRYDPRSPYAASKAAADHLARAWFHTFGLPTIVTNCSNNYGPFQFPEKLIPLVVMNALQGRPLPVYGEGKNVRDWLWVGDHCDALMRVAERGKPGETYAIGGRQERTTMQVVESICSALDELAPSAQPYRKLIELVTDRPGHDHRYAIDPSRIERTLGWSSSLTFEDGLRRTLRWYLDHRAWCDAIAASRYDRERLGLAAVVPVEPSASPDRGAAE